MNKKIHEKLEVAFKRQLNLLADLEDSVDGGRYTTMSAPNEPQQRSSLHVASESLSITVKAGLENVYKDGRSCGVVGEKPVGKRMVIRTFANVRVRSSVSIEVE